MAFFGLIKNKAPRTKSAALPIMLELPAPAELPVEPPPPAASLLPSSDELLMMLFESIATGDEPRLAALCNDYYDFIAEYAPGWLSIPDTLSENPAAAEWYIHGVEQLIDLCTTPPPVAKPPAESALSS